jgi:hypothetical protein
MIVMIFIFNIYTVTILLYLRVSFAILVTLPQCLDDSFRDCRVSLMWSEGQVAERGKDIKVDNIFFAYFWWFY